MAILRVRNHDAHPIVTRVIENSRAAPTNRSRQRIIRLQSNCGWMKPAGTESAVGGRQGRTSIDGEV